MAVLDPHDTLVSFAGSVPLYERKSWYEGDTVGGWRELTLDQIGVRVGKPGMSQPGTPDRVGVVRIAINYIAQNAHKAPIAVQPVVTGDPAEPDTSAELCRIWNASRPTKLMHRILTDLWIRGKGNALLRKVRQEGTSRVEKLEAVDIAKLSWDDQTRFWRQGGTPLIRENYIWITLGADPEFPDKGIDQWGGFDDDLRTLREESTYTADVLQNGGTVGLIISKKDPQDYLGTDVVDRLTKDATAATTGDKRGSVFVVGSGVSVSELGSTPERMALDKLTIGPQSRVAANMRTALMVLGLPDPGKTYSNLSEATKSSYRTAVIGFHDILSECLEMDLLPDTGVGLTQETHRVVWIYDGLEEFREDTDAVHTRARENVKAGIWTPNEGRAETGKEASDQEGADQLTQGSASAPGAIKL